MLWTTPVLVLIITAAMTNSATSLAEAAFFQGIRRVMTPAATRSITAKDLPASAFGVVPAAPDVPVLPGALAVLAPPASPARPADPAPPADESAWRYRMTTARDALERDEVLAAALQSRINALTSDVIGRDDPAQRAELQKQRSRALAEFDRVTLQIEKDKLAIAAIEEDARKKAIPPGWIR